MQPSRSIEGLIAIMAALRTPVTGCAWDLEQDFTSISPFTIEEAYEVADAIRRGDMPDLCEELGDLLLQVVFHARMAEELGHFNFADVCEAITQKMIRRHPHVFGDARTLPPEQIKKLWNQIKQQEKSEKAARLEKAGLPLPKAGLLDSISSHLPALMQSIKLQKQAATVGFDWPDSLQVIEKVEEELREFKTALKENNEVSAREELGDLFFALSNLARKMNVDPEEALQACNDKFRRRFSYIETSLDQKGRSLTEADLEEMEHLWIEAKYKEKVIND
jgi:ATP diphosphatase